MHFIAATWATYKLPNRSRELKRTAAQQLRLDHMIIRREKRTSAGGHLRMLCHIKSYNINDRTPLGHMESTRG